PRSRRWQLSTSQTLVLLGKISYHCCVCNLWIRGLSIYYYWFIIIIIDYVNLPSVCLSRWVSEVTLGVEDALVPASAPPPPCCPGDSGLGPLVGPQNSGGRSRGPGPFLPLPFLRAASISCDFCPEVWGALALEARVTPKQAAALGGGLVSATPSPVLGGPGPGTSPSPATSTHCPRRGGGRAPALSQVSRPSSPPPYLPTPPLPRPWHWGLPHIGSAPS
uniref:Uncharacterized protein n=1 Tax=Panthera leo TaxID=9689 RepID=A0A8C8XZ83_PANLE